MLREGRMETDADFFVCVGRPGRAVSSTATRSVSPCVRVDGGMVAPQHLVELSGEAIADGVIVFSVIKISVFRATQATSTTGRDAFAAS